MVATGTAPTDGWRRAVALSAGLLFLAASWVGPTGLHACPHHGHRPAPAQQSGPSEAPGSHGARHGPSQPGPAPSGPCTCVGTCHAGAATPAVAASGAAGLDAGPTALLDLDPPRDAHRVPDAYLLPYPNGPPLSS